jgi:hypothetical protein
VGFAEGTAFLVLDGKPMFVERPWLALVLRFIARNVVI